MVNRLKLRDDISDKWIERCEKVLVKHLNDYKSDIEINPEHYPSEMHRKIFCPEKGINIKSRYAESLRLIFSHTHTIGVWKNVMVKGTIEPVIGLAIYGHKRNVEIALAIVVYLVDGMERYYDKHTLLLKRKKHVRAVMRKQKLPGELDVRKRTNLNIQNKLKVIVNRLSDNVPGAFIETIKYIQDKEKIDYKKFRNMNTVSYRSMVSRKGVIQLNRIV